MRLNHIIAAMLSAFALTLTACSGAPAATVPIDPMFTTSPIGQLLISKGYTPALNLYRGDQLSGAIYTNCGGEKNLGTCGDTLHDRSTMDKPNIYVERDTDGVLKATRLEGIHFVASVMDNEYLYVPTELRDLTKLSSSELRDVLFKSMDEVHEVLKKASDPNTMNRFNMRVGDKDYGIDAVVHTAA